MAVLNPSYSIGLTDFVISSTTAYTNSDDFSFVKIHSDDMYSPGYKFVPAVFVGLNQKNLNCDSPNDTYVLEGSISGNHIVNDFLNCTREQFDSGNTAYHFFYSLFRNFASIIHKKNYSVFNGVYKQYYGYFARRLRVDDVYEYGFHFTMISDDHQKRDTVFFPIYFNVVFNLSVPCISGSTFSTTDSYSSFKSEVVFTPEAIYRLFENCYQLGFLPIFKDSWLAPDVESFQVFYEYDYPSTNLNISLYLPNDIVSPSVMQHPFGSGIQFYCMTPSTPYNAFASLQTFFPSVGRTLHSAFDTYCSRPHLNSCQYLSADGKCTSYYLAYDRLIPPNSDSTIIPCCSGHIFSKPKLYCSSRYDVVCDYLNSDFTCSRSFTVPCPHGNFVDELKLGYYPRISADCFKKSCSHVFKSSGINHCSATPSYTCPSEHSYTNARVLNYCPVTDEYCDEGYLCTEVDFDSSGLCDYGYFPQWARPIFKCPEVYSSANPECEFRFETGYCNADFYNDSTPCDNNSADFIYEDIGLPPWLLDVSPESVIADFVKSVKDGSVIGFWHGSQEEYDSLLEKQENVFYFIV